MTEDAASSPPVNAPQIDVKRFWRQGYTIVRGLFSPGEIERLRARSADAMADRERVGHVTREVGGEGTTRYGGGDLLSMAQVRDVLLDRRVLGTVKQLLGCEPVYWGDSTLRIGMDGHRMWHRDNPDRWDLNLPDWTDPYPLVRCGLYLQDHSRHSGGVQVRPRSNRSTLREKGLTRAWPSFGGRRISALLPGRFVASEPGDMVVWELRTMHSGEVARLRPLPPLPMSPALQGALPSWLRVPESAERMVMFMTFGCPGPQLDRYIDWARDKDWMLASWAGSRFGPEVWDAARDAGLEILAVTPEYGSPPDGAGNEQGT
jgi:hypothetical protein